MAKHKFIFVNVTSLTLARLEIAFLTLNANVLKELIN